MLDNWTRLVLSSGKLALQKSLPGSLLGVVGGAGVLNGSKTPNFVEKSGTFSVAGFEPPFLGSSLLWLQTNISHLEFVAKLNTKAENSA